VVGYFFVNFIPNLVLLVYAGWIVHFGNIENLYIENHIFGFLCFCVFCVVDGRGHFGLGKFSRKYNSKILKVRKLNSTLFFPEKWL
jgi:hypothetical protein